ncbi:reverse transcriptase domain-containing protein [Tanacetum coccineum]
MLNIVSFKLEGYDIQYRPRTSIKGQILADFIVERPEEESPDEPMTEPEEIPEPWTLFTDGSSCIDGSGAGLILTNPEGVEFTYAMRFTFEATNNEAEYEALIAGIWIAEQMGVKNLQAHSENKKADALSNIASTSFAHLSKQVLVEELKEKSINEKEILAVVEEEGNTWMTPICEYLTKEILLADKKKARAIRRKAVRYGLTGKLYQTWKQFRDNPFKDWCEKLCIRQCFASVKHPQTNGLVERANRSLGEGIKARLDERSKDWIEELSHNPRVRGTSFRPGDMVYRSNDASHARDVGKLGPKWEGPYEVAESHGKGACKLKDCKGNELPRTWNIHDYVNIALRTLVIDDELGIIKNTSIMGDINEMTMEEYMAMTRTDNGARVVGPKIGET